MNAKWGQQTRIDAAKDLLVQTMDSLKDVSDLEIALRVYGHQSPITATYQDCNDTKLEVPFSAGNIGGSGRGNIGRVGINGDEPKIPK
mgnify:CR=1 FL=1